MHPHLPVVYPFLHGGTALVCVVALAESGSSRLATRWIWIWSFHGPVRVFRIYPVVACQSITIRLYIFHYHGRRRKGASLTVLSSTSGSHLLHRSKRSRVCLLTLFHILMPVYQHRRSTEEMARSTRLDPFPLSNACLIHLYSAEE